MSYIVIDRISGNVFEYEDEDDILDMKHEFDSSVHDSIDKLVDLLKRDGANGTWETQQLESYLGVTVRHVDDSIVKCRACDNLHRLSASDLDTIRSTMRPTGYDGNPFNIGVFIIDSHLVDTRLADEETERCLNERPSWEESR